MRLFIDAFNWKAVVLRSLSSCRGGSDSLSSDSLILLIRVSLTSCCFSDSDQQEAQADAAAVLTVKEQT